VFATCEGDVHQLEFWPRERISPKELAVVVADIRNHYWIIRNTRRGMHDARRRRVYRKIETQKKRLLEAGVTKREILDFLACCRSKVCRGQGCFGCVERSAQRLEYPHNLT
jgi:hypothetical protein